MGECSVDDWRGSRKLLMRMRKIVRPYVSLKMVTICAVHGRWQARIFVCYMDVLQPSLFIPMCSSPSWWCSQLHTHSSCGDECCRLFQPLSVAKEVGRQRCCSHRVGMLFGTPSAKVRVPGAVMDFPPRVNFQCRLSYGVRTPPCAIACIILTSLHTLKIPWSISEFVGLWKH